MKRYTIYVIPDRDMEAEECIDGEWVRFEDYQQEVEQLKVERDRWKKRADELFFAESSREPQPAEHKA